MAKPDFFRKNPLRLALFNLFGSYVKNLALMPTLTEDNTALNPDLLATSSNMKRSADNTHFVEYGIRRFDDVRRDTVANAHYKETRMVTAGYINTLQTQILQRTFFTQKGLVKYFTDFVEDKEKYDAHLITLDTDTPLGFLTLPVGYMVKAEILEIPQVTKRQKERVEKKHRPPVAHLRDALGLAAYNTSMDNRLLLQQAFEKAFAEGGVGAEHAGVTIGDDKPP